jgi:hypothetical protein
MGSLLRLAERSAGVLPEEKNKSTIEELWMRVLRLIELVSGSSFTKNTNNGPTAQTSFQRVYFTGS